MKILCSMTLVVNPMIDRHLQWHRHLAVRAKTRLKASFLLMIIAVFLCSAVACQRQPALPTIVLSGATMGTTYHITLVSVPEAITTAQLQQATDALLLSINQQMSTYIEDSEISQFNRLPVDQWLPISEDFQAVLLLSQQIAAVTDGKFDITVGPLIELWGFGNTLNQQIPDPEAIADAKAKTGWRYLSIDQQTQRITKSRELSLNVSAIAKGFAVDKLAAYYQSQGIANYLVEIGGEMRVQGTNAQGVLWKIGIEKPALLQQQQAQQIVSLDNQAVATSGDYRNYFEENGQRFSHTIDPETGYPVRHNIASVTVIAPTAAAADGFATALNVLGEKHALALAETEKLAAYFILYDDQSESGYRTVTSPYFTAATMR
ncbi:MAG: FAD:protein FMN transferase [Cellvibrionaceae bacterium]|nr:FAD:protein FMN transferase [Cellvibrionaceae bacterium]